IALRQAGDDVPVAGQSLRLDAAVRQRLQQGAAGLLVVTAVAEAAAAEQVAELDEAGFHIVAADVRQAELADTGRVDQIAALREMEQPRRGGDRKSTRLNSSHVKISYAVFCLKKKNMRKI